MVLFESMLTLLLVAIVLLQVSRRLSVPYPTMLALAGVVVAALPWAPDIGIDPRLALALFIAPALLDAAFDFPPRALRRYWLPLLALAAVAVLLTTAAVAWAGVALAGLPLAAAIALGAIVAPPDAAAATAVLSRYSLPRRTVTVLKGESLLNDAVALLIFGAALSFSGTATPTPALWGEIALAVPGGLLLGLLIGRVYMRLRRFLAGTLGGTLFEFTATFGTWVIAEHLHLSAILAVVAYAMTVASTAPERTSPRDRVHSYSVWGAVVFLLNVLAFLLMGLQARGIVLRLDAGELGHALGFAAVVFAIVVVVRMAWVLAYNRWAAWRRSPEPDAAPASLAESLVVSWCGMRGLVTLATALALPAAFPSRDLIVLTALVVVLGTLIVQGLTLGPLIRRLRIKPDDSFGTELNAARLRLVDAGIDSLAGQTGDDARSLLESYRKDRAIVAGGQHPRAVTELNDLRRRALATKRQRLVELRRSGEIDDDVFHALEEELDWAELAAAPPGRYEIIEN
ncbi:MAG: cation:proton antiporter [Solimonas sp.]